MKKRKVLSIIMAIILSLFILLLIVMFLFSGTLTMTSTSGSNNSNDISADSIIGQESFVDRLSFNVSYNSPEIREIKQTYTKPESRMIQSQIEPVIEEKLPNSEIKHRDNPVKLVKEEPISTFSVDIDDGSYKLFKDYVKRGNLIDKNLVRPEEFVNAFQYDYPNAENIEKPFSTTLKITKSPWSENYLLLVGIKGYEYDLNSLPPVNLTFLVDVSGSMSSYLGKVKVGLNMLVDKLRPEDRISIVTYAGNTTVLLENTEIENIKEIKRAIDSLSSGGGTNGESGIKLAYEENEDNYIKGGVNRIILMSDGDFNVGVSNISDLEELIKEKRKSGITFSTVGLGGGNYRDNLMETMSNKGNGAYTYIADVNDARSVFADRFISTIKNIAKDVKYQIEFNPENVKEYRLIGYENRMLKTEDFNNDKVDAGEISSGTTTTAIYEITLSDQKGFFPESRYSNKESKSNKDLTNELAFLKIRFKQPEADKSELLTFPVNKDIIEKDITQDNKFAISVAGFAQLYKDNKFLNTDYNYDKLIEDLEDLELKNKQYEILELIKTVKALK
tara:strand:+ start:3947 stop:5629 length:1683 start_codon:yes stop_codon:yes gene_type:complete